jgi:DMSO/TMAO reductase YedYZ heme-binding membrane subunit
MRAPAGREIIALALLVLAAGVAAIAARDGWSEAGVRQVVRSSAQIGVVLFCLAFGASSLRVFWRTPGSAWLLRNRRYLGLSFAASHTLHLAALGALALAFPDPFVGGLSASTVVGGGLCYAFIYAQAATSNDASVRALGRRRWTLLHRVGSYFIWFVFAQSYFARVPRDPYYIVPSLLLVATVGLRVARRLRRSVARGAHAADPAPGGSAARSGASMDC